MELGKGLSDTFSTINEYLNFKLFSIKETPVSVISILMFLFVIFCFYVISSIITRIILKRAVSRFNIDAGIQYTLLRISHYLIMITGTVVAFQFVGVDLAGLAVIFGLLSVGIGFGLQNITSNFISGLILLFERPIKVGDRVTVGDVEGDVVAINMRSTTIKTLRNIAIIVPNSQFISEKVTNWSYGDPVIRSDIEVGVSYNSDLDLVMKALTEVVEGHSAVLDDPKSDILFKSFGDSSWNMTLRCWLSGTQGYYQIRSELHEAIVRKFREYNIEIPYPQRDLHVRSPLPVPLEYAKEN
ncbi:MAG: mechanosensitive ion channel [candidate division Zixibacteria bacterium]|nr:mechanosensitive ion channel [candidate division Zixibacteria bacterium]